MINELSVLFGFDEREIHSICIAGKSKTTKNGVKIFIVATSASDILSSTELF